MNSILKSKTMRWLFVGIALLFLAACTQPGDDGDGNGNGDPDPDVVTLTVNVSGDGSVEAMDSDGTALDLPATFDPTEAAQVTLEATPTNEGATVVWGGACVGAEENTCNVTMDEDRTVSVTFEEEGTDPTDPGEGTTVSSAVTEAGNDAEELADSDLEYDPGHVYTSSSDLDLVYDGNSDHNSLQHVGIRFTDVSIPADAEVTAAYITFTAAEVGTGSVEITVEGELATDAEVFVDGSNGTISSRTVTGSAPWSVDEDWAAGLTYDTDDLSGIVQEIVDLEGWTAGNAMAFILSGSDSSNYRVAQAAGEGRTGPVLHVTYVVPDETGSEDGGGEGTGTDL